MPQFNVVGLAPFKRVRSLFIRDEEGATAVEFALIAAPFFALLSFMLLGGHILWMAHSMETAIQTVSRQIRTGQAQAAGMSMAQFRQAICSQVATSETECTQNLIVDVRRFERPEDINFNPPKENDSLDQSAGLFQMGDREDYVIVKVYLQIGYITALTGLLGSSQNFDIPLSATAAFRNEPF